MARKKATFEKLLFKIHPFWIKLQLLRFLPFNFQLNDLGLLLLNRSPSPLWAFTIVTSLVNKLHPATSTGMASARRVFQILSVHKYSPKLIIQADLNRGIPFDPLFSLLRLLSCVSCLWLVARSFVVLPFLLLEGCC